MDIHEANKRIEELRTLLWENSRRYYVENSPTMSDFEFDARMHELEALEAQFPELITPDSPTQKVGSDLEEDGGARGGFAQYPHRYPMLSLGNTYNIEDIEAFVQRAEKVLDRCSALRGSSTSSPVRRIWATEQLYSPKSLS